jgi:hypothetical protein
MAYKEADKDLQQDLVIINNPLDKVSQINGYSFTWNSVAETTFSGKLSGIGGQYGVVAQEVELAVPEAVRTQPTGYKAVDSDQLIPLLIECIKDLSNRVSELENS